METFEVTIKLTIQLEPIAGFEPALRVSILITSQAESTTVPYRQVLIQHKYIKKNQVNLPTTDFRFHLLAQPLHGRMISKASSSAYPYAFVVLSLRSSRNWLSSPFGTQRI